MLIEFDVTLPFDRQLEGAHYALRLEAERREVRHSSVRLRVDKFPQYLRLLDFQEAGASDDVIGEHLFPGASGEKLRDRIRTNFDLARQWQDKHWHIALQSDAS